MQHRGTCQPLGLCVALDMLGEGCRGASERKVASMPFINVRLIEGVFSPEQKHEIIRKLTDTMVSIEGENMRPVTWVVLEEVKSGDWGIAGSPLTTEDVKALAAGKNVK